jgi:hypothetical protein
MTKWSIPEGRKPLTDADTADTAPAPAGVTVKPLVWGYHPAGAIAAPPTGHAYIIDTRMKGRVYSIKGFNPAREFESKDEAKAAAQADYEARIMAALEPSPAGVTVPDELYQAAKRDAEEAEAYAAELEAKLKLADEISNLQADRIQALEEERRKTFQALLRTTKIHDEAEAYAAELEAALKLHQDLDAISVAAVNSLTAQLAQAVEALELADAALSGANMNMRAVEKKVKATIAELKGDRGASGEE